ncbi:NADH dehydrogenase [ubiquinone] 1 alpha subcomplex assembly factor 3 [Termitomyces sp. J132]|nr:hypothetical protein H2248_006780 [Termitomyces sp. 'cryptogamus']KNZ76432.1 NADH dehydrogenase [ubiquinone] 1 alpha subcomplex assembly factor 3 [Termitomyces sp. J132]
MSLRRALQLGAPQLLRSSLVVSRNTRILARPCYNRKLHATTARRDSSFTNILADDNPPAVQVKSITNAGIRLQDGLMVPCACIFLEGEVLLWDVPKTLWTGWGTEHFEIFETVVPRPEILLLGTGKSIANVPVDLRTYLNKLGIQLDVMDTRNACSTYNILSEEGRRVAAALLPLTPHSWKKARAPRSKSSK